MKFLLIVFSFFLMSGSYSQPDTLPPPYQKFPIFPPVKLTLPDKEIFTKKDLPKKKPVMLMLFSPLCEHCQLETEEILEKIDKFSKSTIVMATVMPYDSMMSFRGKYKLADHQNIIVGQDTQFFLPVFFKVSQLPFLAFYDKKGKLISVFEGSMPVDKAITELQKKAADE